MFEWSVALKTWMQISTYRPTGDNVAAIGERSNVVNSTFRQRRRPELYTVITAVMNELIPPAQCS